MAKYWYRCEYTKDGSVVSCEGSLGEITHETRCAAALRHEIHAHYGGILMHGFVYKMLDERRFAISPVVRVGPTTHHLMDNVIPISTHVEKKDSRFTFMDKYREMVPDPTEFGTEIPLPETFSTVNFLQETKQ